MRSKISLRFFTVLCLVGTTWALLATSSADGTLYGTFDAKSDCVSPVLQTAITVSNSEITSPAGFDFTTLGFPTTTLNFNSPSTGLVNGANRVCTRTVHYNDDWDDTFVYTCDDDGVFVCSVFMRER